MSSTPRVLRPTESQQRERLAELRSQMDAAEIEDTPTAKEPPTDFAGVLEQEIRDLLALDYSHLPPQQRHYLLRAGVALWAAKNAKGPVWGAELDEPA